MVVYLLFHTNEVNPGEDEDKLIGVYSSRKNAEAARDRAARLPGFRDVPAGFCIDECSLDEDHWTEGYITVRPGEG